MRLFDRSSSLLFASVLSFCTLWGGQAIAQTAPAASEEMLLREMLLRTFELDSNFESDSEVLPGQLPPQAIDLPLPDQTRIIGSITSTDSAAGSSYIFLDVPRSPQQVADFYQEQLRQMGWSDTTLSNHPPGFVPTRSNDSPNFNSTFCKNAQMLVLTVRPLPNVQTATVLLYIVRMPNLPSSLCNRPEAAISGSSSSFLVPVPALTAPPDTQVRDPQSESSSVDGDSIDNWRANATIESSLTNQAIASHYVSQLEQAGWQQQVSDTTDSTAWSFLTLQDDEEQRWQGFLSIVPAAEPNTYTASVFVIKTSSTSSSFF